MPGPGPILYTTIWLLSTDDDAEAKAKADTFLATIKFVYIIKDYKKELFLTAFLFSPSYSSPWVLSQMMTSRAYVHSTGLLFPDLVSSLLLCIA